MLCKRMGRTVLVAALSLSFTAGGVARTDADALLAAEGCPTRPREPAVREPPPDGTSLERTLPAYLDELPAIARRARPDPGALELEIRREEPSDSVLFEKALLAIRERFLPNEVALGVDPRPLDANTWYEYPNNLPKVDPGVVAARERVARRLDFEIVEVPTSTKCGGQLSACYMISLPRVWHALPGWADASCNAARSRAGRWWSVRWFHYPRAWDHGSTYEYFFRLSPSKRSHDLICTVYVPLGA